MALAEAQWGPLAAGTCGHQHHCAARAGGRDRSIPTQNYCDVPANHLSDRSVYTRVLALFSTWRVFTLDKDAAGVPIGLISPCFSLVISRLPGPGCCTRLLPCLCLLRRQLLPLLPNGLELLAPLCGRCRLLLGDARHGEARQQRDHEAPET